MGGLGFRIGLTFGHAQAHPALQVVRVACCQHEIYSRTTVIGYYQAADAEEAIKQAIVEREIGDPLTQARLAAQKVREVSR
jgi:hypothetical protein